MSDRALELLIESRAIIADGRWSKGQFAKRQNGRWCSATDPRAVAFCPLGAIDFCAGIATGEMYPSEKIPPEVEEAIADLASAIGITADEMPTWNDRWWRTRRSVLKAFDRAIAVRMREMPPEITHPTNPKQTHVISMRM